MGVKFVLQKSNTGKEHFDRSGNQMYKCFAHIHSTTSKKKTSISYIFKKWDLRDAVQFWLNISTQSLSSQINQSVSFF